MSLILTLERAPHPQSVRQITLQTGELVIGRGADADWRIDDPDLFVSRAHCRIVGRPGSYVVTDTSSGGLYVDEARSPLGSGNSVPLADGMRLRLGDFVVKVSMETARPVERSAPLAPERAAAYDPPPGAGSRVSTRGERGSSFGDDDFFAPRPKAEPAAPRPAALPDPFEAPVAGAWSTASQAPARRSSPAFDDPFSLDALPSTPAPRPEPPPSRPEAPARMQPPPPAPVPPAPDTVAEALPAAPPAPDAPAPVPARETVAPEAPAPEPVRVRVEPEAPAPAPVRAKAEPAPSEPRVLPAAAGGEELRDAFLRGLGLDPADLTARDPVAEMEAFGRSYRLMVEGYMHLLRKRAEEKGNARIAQTTVGSSDVNPLKFMPNADAVLDGFAGGTRPGFLDPEAAITGAIRDLAHHHVSAWRGVQAALGRMIDRFDPEALEEELKSRSTLETLLAGGRKAKLWELYEQRFREIARSAEARFLGEVGADFRDAYEEKDE